MPFSLSVAISEEPWATLRVLSPLTTMFTFPLGLRYFLATSNTTTSKRMTTKNTPMLAMINELFMITFLRVYSLMPEKQSMAMAISPTVMKVMPRPCKGLGTWQ